MFNNPAAKTKLEQIEIDVLETLKQLLEKFNDYEVNLKNTDEPKEPVLE